jgi:PAS domain S-box-containing protein
MMAKAQILIVEDDNIVVMELRARLQSSGYAIAAVASHGEEAVAKAGETGPDLVLMDIKLKGSMDGVKAAEKIRDDFDIPVVYLTAYADEDTLRRAKITEPHGYIIKPFEERELYSTIEMALNKHKIEKELKERERWLATTLESIGDAVIATDKKGLVTFMNPVAEALTGWKQEEALGKVSTEVFHIINEETRTLAESPVTKALREGVIGGLANHSLLIAKDGREIPIDNSAAPIKDDKGKVVGVVLVFRDITERRRAEEQIQQRTEDLALINSLNDAVNMGSSLQKIIQLLSRETGRVFSCNGATVYLLSEDREYLVMQNLSLPPTVVNQIEKLIGMKIPAVRIPLKAESLHLKALQAGKPQLINDPATIQGLMAESTENKALKKLVPKLFKPLSIHSVISVPLMAEGETIGLLSVSRREPFTESDLQRFETISGQITAVIKRKQAEETLARHNRELAALNAVVAMVSRSLHLEEVTQQAVDLIHQHLGYTNVALLLVDEKTDELYVKAACGYPQGVQGLRLKIGQEGITGWVAVHREPLLIPDVRQDPRYVMGAEGICSELTVPVMLGEKLLGVLDVQSDRVAAFGEDDLGALTTLAGQIAVAIGNAQLFEAEQKRATQLAVVNRVARQAASILDPDQLLQKIVTAIQQGFDYHNVALFLLDEAAGELGMGAIAGGFQDVVAPDYRQAVGVGMVGWTAETGQPLLANDVSQEPRYIPGFLEEVATRSELCVPLKLAGQVIGVLDVQETRLNTFDEADLLAMQTLADQMAVAIENARLFGETKRRFEETTVLYQTSLDITAQLEMTELLKSIVERAVTILQARAGGIYLYNPEQEELRMTIGYDYTEKHVGVTLKPGEGMAGKVFQTGQPLIVDDYRTWEGRAPVYEADQPFTAVLEVPLKWRERIIGVLAINADAQQRTFSQDDIWLATLFANQATVAIENARMYEEERERATQLELIGGITQRIASILDLDELLSQVTHLIGDTFGYYRVSVFLVETKSNELVLKADTSPLDETQVGRLRLKIGQEGIRGWVAHSGEPLLVNDISLDPRYYFREEAKDTRSELAVPIKLKEKITGVLNVESIELDAFNQNDVFTLQTLADQLAIAIENTRLYESEQTRRHVADTLRGVSSVLSSTLSLDDVLHLILEQLENVLTYDTASVATLRGDALEISATRGYADTDLVIGARLPIADSAILHQMMHGKEAVVIPDVREDERWIWVSGAEHVRSWIGVPLLLKDKMVGALMMDKAEPNFYSPHDAQLVFAFANQAAMAIENARLYEAEAQQRREAETLQEAALALTTSLDRNQVIERILIQLQQVVPYDTASVQLLREDQLEIVGGYGFPSLGGVLGIAFPLGEDNPNSEVVRTRAPFILEDAPAAYDTFRYIPRAQHIRSWLGVPMLVGERLIGIIALDKQQAASYTEEHAQMAQAFAAQAAVAIENARLYEAEAQQRREAETLQEAALALTSTLDLAEALDRILEQLHRVVAYDSASVQLLWEDCLEIVGGRGFADPSAIIGIRFPVPSDNPNTHVIESGEPVILADAQAAHPPFREPPHDHIRSWLGVPVRFQKRIIGLITLDSTELGHFTADHAQLAAAFANQAAIAIENARIYEEERKRVAQLELIGGITQRIVSILDLDELLSQVTHLIRDAFGYYYTSILLVEADSDDLVLRAIAGPIAETLIGLRLKIGQEGITGWVAHSGEPLLVGDVSRDPRHYAMEESKDTQSELAVPIRLKEKTIGVLDVQSVERDAFSQDDVSILQTLADQLAVAIENARLYEQTQRQSERLAQTLTLSEMLHGGLEPEQVLGQIAQGAVELGFRRVVINVRQPGEEWVRARTMVGLEEPEREKLIDATYRWSDFQTLMQERFQVSRSYLIRHGEMDWEKDFQGVVVTPKGKDRGPGYWHPEDMLLVPLLGAEGQPVGLLSIDEPVDGLLPDLNTIQTLEAFANQAAIATENARLYEQVTALAEELEVRVQERTEELAQKAQDLSFLYQASVALSSSLEMEKVLEALAQQAALAVDAVDCTICEVQEDTLVIVGSYSDPALPWQSPESGRRYLLADYPATREAIEKRQPLQVRVDDPLADEAERADLQEWRYTTLLQVPIVSRGQVLGVVEVFDNKPQREFSESDADLLQTIANQAGIAIERARLFHQVREERNHLELLYEVSRKLSASLDLGQTMQDIFQASVVATGASRGSIFVFDEEGRVAHRILMRDLPPTEAEDVIDQVLREGLAGWVLEHKQPAIVFDTSQDERWLPFPDDPEPVGSAMVTPFIERDWVRGLLTLVHPQPYHFKQIHLDLLSSIAHQVAIVIERARLHEHASRRAVQLATAAEVSRDATSILDVGQLLTRTVELIQDRFDLYYAGIFLMDETGQYAVLQAGAGETGQQMLERSHKLKVGGTSMVGQCVASAQARIALDVGEEATRFDNPMLPETRSEMALPLISRGQVIGAMTIQSDRPVAFSQEDVTALQTLADQLANAIENARLYEETRRTAQEIAQQKEQTDAIVQSMADGLIVTDVENRLVLANPAAEELLKFSLKDAIGQDIGASIRDAHLRQIVHDTLDKQQVDHEVDIELTDPYEGTPRIVRAHTAMVNDPTGQPMGIVTTLRDVTHEREVQRLKDELVSTVSHELRTPMTSVLGFSELLLTRSLSEEKRQLYVQTIHKEAQRLSALINDFLDIQRMERGQQEYHFEEVDLAELAHEAVATYSGQSQAHTLTLDLPPDLPVVQADPDRLRQVFGNLLSNAIKFSPEGGKVTVSVQVEDEEIQVAVSDEGIGIPAKALPHIFDKFFRVDSSDRREIQGAGLGLAICKGIVEAHRGRIWAESPSTLLRTGPSTLPFDSAQDKLRTDQEGVGTTVTFSLPMTARKRVLVIDDEKDIRELLQESLRRDYEVFTASNGQEGLSLMEAELPDLVILDIAMPVMNGYQFLEKVKGDQRMKDVLVIAISGVDTNIDRLKELGMDEFLSKPFSGTVLLETMQRLLTRS